ncbi:MAG: hypothetical protein KME17_29255 [Cyanosarcina radialis HA8281-LM2]|jgi:hypothetical protein|nr:hypothetical protein [Cyanosarcina radialis HA8281-LM2]
MNQLPRLLDRIHQAIAIEHFSFQTEKSVEAIRTPRTLCDRISIDL